MSNKNNKFVYVVVLSGALQSYGISTSILGVYSGKKKAEDAIFHAYTEKIRFLPDPPSLSQFRQMTKVWELPVNHTFDVEGDAQQLLTHVYLGSYFE